MLLRLATFGALGYAAYKYYENNREQVDGVLRDLFPGQEPGPEESAEGAPIAVAGGPLSDEAHVVSADSPEVA